VPPTLSDPERSWAGMKVFLLRPGPPNARDLLRQIVATWNSLVGDLRAKPVAQQRQLLRKLVPDRITVTPHVTATRKWVDWAGDLVLAPIIYGIAPAVGDVMPDYPMDRRWWPQGEPDARPFAVTLPLAGGLTLLAA
jgi:hypothetical protein